MYTNSSEYQKIILRKVLAILVAICMFMMFVWIMTAVVVMLVNRTGRINATVVSEITYNSGTVIESTIVTTEQYTTITRGYVTITSSHVPKKTPSKHYTTTITTAAATTLGSTHHSSTVQSDTTSEILVSMSTEIPFIITATTSRSIPECLLTNVDNVIKKDCWAVQRDVVKGCSYMLPRKLTQVVVRETKTNNCYTNEDCLNLLRMTMSNHLRKYKDINYNFIITGDGHTYEGRSWTCRVDDNLESSKSIHIAFTGNPADEVTNQQIKSLQKLLESGNKNGYLKYNYKVKPYCCVVSSDNPDKYVFSLIQNITHFYSDCNDTPNCKWKN